jgi:hypothetical protein
MSTRPRNIESKGLCRGFAAAAALFVAAVAAPRPASADTEADRTLAEALFREGKRLMGEEKYAAACAQLGESQRLDPGGGTLLLLGLCHEKEGKTATAWGELREASAIAAKEGQSMRREVAERHIAALEPRLARLTIRVPERVARVPGLELLRNGAPLGRAAWGMAFPVDPGRHAIEARAPGKVARMHQVDVGEAEQRTLEVEEPADAPKAAPVVAPIAPRAAPPPASGGDVRRPIGFAVGGLGLVLAGVGTYFGVKALDAKGDVTRQCPAGACRSVDGVLRNEQGRSAADASTAFLILGGAAVGTGLVLVLTGGARSPSRADAPRLVPAATGRGGGGAIVGAW